MTAWFFTALVLAIWAGATFGSHPFAAFLVEALTRIELRALAGDLPWIP